MTSPLISVTAAASKYRGVQLQTSSPAQLVVMLYDGILRFVTEAHAAIETDDRARMGDRVGRALAIVDELTATLDPKYAPELAENMTALYGFCKRRLYEANLHRDPQALADVKTAIVPLRDAFASISGK
ncbi:MAG: flagellar export chaperone FliS [Labilithrix sp.]|nr:flagellar export chaperone FliS [Labilithrix sp.]MCW5817179.1 flagellar export chaperone FliS [Labilithrix sp.]